MPHLSPASQRSHAGRAFRPYARSRSSCSLGNGVAIDRKLDDVNQSIAHVPAGEIIPARVVFQF
jgi:hypothetical protein